MACFFISFLGEQLMEYGELYVDNENFNDSLI